MRVFPSILTSIIIVPLQSNVGSGIFHFLNKCLLFFKFGENILAHSTDVSLECGILLIFPFLDFGTKATLDVINVHCSLLLYS